MDLMSWSLTRATHPPKLNLNPFITSQIACRRLCSSQAGSQIQNQDDELLIRTLELLDPGARQARRRYSIHELELFEI